VSQATYVNMRTNFKYSQISYIETWLPFVL